MQLINSLKSTAFNQLVDIYSIILLLFYLDQIFLPIIIYLRLNMPHIQTFIKFHTF